MKNTFGSALGLTIFGESHGAGVGAVLDGMAAGVPVDYAALAALMDKRRARGDGLSTARVEADEIRILSGVVDGHTTGTPITLLIENHNTRSADYAATAALLRPGHADYTAYARYPRLSGCTGRGALLGADHRRPGGRGRRRAGGAGTGGGAHRHPTSPAAPAWPTPPLPRTTRRPWPPKWMSWPPAGRASPCWTRAPKRPCRPPSGPQARRGTAWGAFLETAILGLPAGVGEPFFDSVESVLAHMAFSVPAVKGIEFGAGFGFADLRGSQANDPLRIRDGHIYTETNRNAGINGGLANGCRWSTARW